VRLTLPDGRQVSREPDIVVVLNDRRAHSLSNTLTARRILSWRLSAHRARLTTEKSSSSTKSAGVPEYWIIDPEREYAEFWQLDNTGAYRVAYAGSTGVYHSRELPGFWLRLEWIWRQQPLLDVLREWGILPQGV
jgi:hypothetical protein